MAFPFMPRCYNDAPRAVALCLALLTGVVPASGGPAPAAPRQSEVPPGGAAATVAPEGEAPAEAAPAPAGTAAADRRIEERLRGIYRHLDELSGVRVEVGAGVVTLTGEVLSREDREEAERLARTVEGVVAVENRTREVRDVQRRLAPVLERLEERLYGFLVSIPLLLVAALVVALFWWLGVWVGRWQRPFRRLTKNRFLLDLYRGVARAGVGLVGLLLALEVLGATALVGAVLGTAGVVGLAVGFAFRDLVENYIASVLLSLRQPFSPNDLVRIDDQEGKVVRLTTRATVLLTLDGNHLRIPNATVFKGTILNYTLNPLRRVGFDVGVGNGEDLAAVGELGVATLAAMEGVEADPAPFARIRELGDSSVAVTFHAWIDQRRAAPDKVRSEGMRVVKNAFDAAGVEMPEPTYRVLRVESEHEAPGARRPARVDVAVDTHLDEQVRQERAAEEPDLLDAEAPRE